MAEPETVPWIEPAKRIAAVMGNAAQQVELRYDGTLVRLREWQRGTPAGGAVGGGLERCWDASCPECPMPGSEFREDREHMHPIKRGDPTGNRAFTRDSIDSMRADYERAVRQAYTASLVILHTHDVVFPRGEPGQAPDPTDWCRNHLSTIGECVPRHRGDTCRSCYDYQRANRQLPNREILLAWHDGRRVTQSMVSKALTKPKRKKAG